MIEELRRIDVESTTRALGAGLGELATSLLSDGVVTEITGRGCFIGLGLRTEDQAPLSGAEVLHAVAAIARNGVLVQPGPSSIELIPAYGFTADELHEVGAAIRSGLAQAQEASA